MSLNKMPLPLLAAYAVSLSLFAVGKFGEFSALHQYPALLIGIGACGWGVMAWVAFVKRHIASRKPL